MSKADLTAEVFVEFRRVIAQVVLYNDHVAQRTGINASESQFMHLLALNGPSTPSELASASGLSSGSVTAVVDRLESLGFVRRDRHPTDRRKVVVVLLEEKVTQTMAPYYVEQGEQLARVVAQFSATELDAVHRFLTALTAEQ